MYRIPARTSVLPRLADSYDVYDISYEVKRDVSRHRVEKISLSSSSQFTKHYKLESENKKPVGYGTFGEIYLCRSISSPKHDLVAVKAMNKEKQPYFSREVEMLKRVAHSKYCLNLDRILTTPNNVYLVTEYLKGGDLFDYICDHNVGLNTLSIKDALFLAKKMLQGIEECHLQNFSHLDVKPENFVFRQPVNETGVEDSELILVDFGAAQPYVNRPFARGPETYIKGMDDLWKGHKQIKFTGTASYISPEIFLSNRFSSRSDVWSLGVSLYMMLTGERPFDSTCAKEVQALVIEESQRPRAESIFVRSKTLNSINCPQNVRRFLETLTEPLPQNRPSSTEALREISEILNKF